MEAHIVGTVNRTTSLEGNDSISGSFLSKISFYEDWMHVNRPVLTAI